MTDQPNIQQPLPMSSGCPTVEIPAPRPNYIQQEIKGVQWNTLPPWLTLRDWFAGLAMQGLLSCELDHDGKIQVSAYEYADRMLAERAAEQVKRE